MTRRQLLLVSILVLGSAAIINGYVTSMPRAVRFAFIHKRHVTTLRAQPDETEGTPLNRLGFSDQEIQRSRSTGDKEQLKVKVSLIPDVDAVTLTAIGFSLIAANFFIFANLGDGGIAGLVATIINLSNQ